MVFIARKGHRHQKTNNMKPPRTYAIEYEILRADSDELVEGGETVEQGEDILDVVLRLEDNLLAPEERDEYRVRVLKITNV